MSGDGRQQLPLEALQSMANSRALEKAMNAWAQQRGGIGSGGARDGYGEINFHWKTGQGEQRAELTLWADLNSEDRPVIRVSFPPGFEPDVPVQAHAATVDRSQSDEMFDIRDGRAGEIPHEIAWFIRANTSRELPPNFPAG